MSLATLPIEIQAEPDTPTTAPTKSATRAKPGPKPGLTAIPKPKRSAGEQSRFFLAHAPFTSETPELGEEIGSEAEALVRAFRSEHGVFYRVEVYRAEIEMQGENPVIVKKAAAK